MYYSLQLLFVLIYLLPAFFKTSNIKITGKGAQNTNCMTSYYYRIKGTFEATSTAPVLLCCQFFLLYKMIYKCFVSTKPSLTLFSMRTAQKGHLALNSNFHYQQCDFLRFIIVKFKNFIGSGHVTMATKKKYLQ